MGLHEKDFLYKDFYLVAPNRSLIVSRGATPILSSGDPLRGLEEVLMENIKFGKHRSGVTIFNLTSWRDANGNAPTNIVPELVQKYCGNTN